MITGIIPSRLGIVLLEPDLHRNPDNVPAATPTTEVSSQETTTQISIRNAKISAYRDK